MNRIITTGLAVVAIFLLLTAIIMPLKNDNNAVDYKQSDNSVSAVEQSYTVRAYHGKIAVFEAGSSEPIKITDTDIRILPQADKKLLETGIPADSLSDISKILEDYCS